MSRKRPPAPGRDPLGKRALFSEPDAPGSERSASPGEKRAVFSEVSRDPSMILVHCSACDAVTPLTAFSFLVQHLPAWLWVPWRKQSHFMRCPACGKFAWHSAS